MARRGRAGSAVIRFNPASSVYSCTRGMRTVKKSSSASNAPGPTKVRGRHRRARSGAGMPRAASGGMVTVALASAMSATIFIALHSPA